MGSVQGARWCGLFPWSVSLPEERERGCPGRPAWWLQIVEDPRHDPRLRFQGRGTGEVQSDFAVQGRLSLEDPQEHFGALRRTATTHQFGDAVSDLSGTRRACQHEAGQFWRSSQTQILPFALLFCVSNSIYPEVSAAELGSLKCCSGSSRLSRPCTVRPLCTSPALLRSTLRPALCRGFSTTHI